MQQVIGCQLTTRDNILHLYNATTVCFTNRIQLQNIKSLNKPFQRLVVFISKICLFLYFTVTLC